MTARDVYEKLKLAVPDLPELTLDENIPTVFTKAFKSTVAFEMNVNKYGIPYSALSRCSASPMSVLMQAKKKSAPVKRGKVTYVFSNKLPPNGMMIEFGTRGPDYGATEFGVMFRGLLSTKKHDESNVLLPYASFAGVTVNDLVENMAISVGRALSKMGKIYFFNAMPGAVQVQVNPYTEGKNATTETIDAFEELCNNGDKYIELEEPNETFGFSYDNIGAAFFRTREKYLRQAIVMFLYRASNIVVTYGDPEHAIEQR